MLHDEVLRLAGLGKSSEDVAAWLWREHKIEVSSRMVRVLIRRRRTEQADVAKSVVRDEIRKFLLPALQRAARGGIAAERIEKRWRAEAARARLAGDLESAHNADALALKALDRQRAIADRLMHWAGIDQPDQAGDKGASRAELREQLLRRIQVLRGETPTAQPNGHAIQTAADEGEQVN